MKYFPNSNIESFSKANGAGTGVCKPGPIGIGIALLPLPVSSLM